MPLVNRYFDQVAKHKRYKKSYESGREPGHWYHGLDYTGGAAGNVTQAGPGRQDPEGGVGNKMGMPQGSAPGYTPSQAKSQVARAYGVGRGKKEMMARGGLMGIPLPGRSRDI